MAKFIEADLCYQDMESAFDLTGTILTVSLGRAKTHTNNMLMELYKEVLGKYEPNKEMPVSEIIFRLKEIQTNKPPKSE